MALYQRKGIYYVKITKPDGATTRHSAGTRDKQEAQEYHDRLKAKLWEQARLGVKPKRSWDEAALKWLQEKAGKRSYVDDVQRTRWFTQHLRGLTLDEVTRDRVDDLLSNKLTDVTNSTRDRYVALVRGVMRRAKREWEWIDNVPAFRTYEKNKKGRIRWLKVSQVKTLLQELPYHTRAVMLFSLATGRRMSNVLSLEWANVSLERRVAYFPDTKNGDPQSVPLNDLALMVLELEQGRHATYVFTYRGQPLERTNTKAWKKALKRAGIEDFRWHDLRHTWASWLRQSGVPTWALQELGGWKTEAMVRRYAHINVDHLAPYAAQLGTLLDTPTILSELGNKLTP